MAFFWCVLVTAAIGVLFKLFPRWRVHTFHAIVVNYTLCLVLGTWLDPAVDFPFEARVRQAPWFPWDILIGFLFISGFNLAARAVQDAGMTVTTLMQKMSILLTVTVAVLAFREPAGMVKMLGLGAAALSILLVNRPAPGTLQSLRHRQWVELFFVWLIAAAVEIVLLGTERSGLLADQQMAFTTHGFGVAGIIGWTIILFRLAGGRPGPTLRDAAAGILLGIPNFFSIFLLLVMLKHGWQATILYPLLNVTVLVTAALIAVIAFRERLTRTNWTGIALAIAAILLIAWSENRPA